MTEVIQSIAEAVSMEQVARFIKFGFSRAKCHEIHPFSCNQFCFNYLFTSWAATYKTYGVVYLISLLFRFKKIAKNPLRQIPKFIFDYLRSTSLTTVQMMIMRRILCFLTEHYSHRQNNLIWANFFSAFYLFVQPRSRQPQIALYQLNNTALVIYLMAKRRGYIKPLPHGQCILFALAISIICFYFYDCKEAFRRSYILTIFQHLLGQK